MRLCTPYEFTEMARTVLVAMFCRIAEKLILLFTASHYSDPTNYPLGKYSYQITETCCLYPSCWIPGKNSQLRKHSTYGTNSQRSVSATSTLLLAKRWGKMRKRIVFQISRKKEQRLQAIEQKESKSRKDKKPVVHPHKLWIWSVSSHPASFSE